MVPTLKVASQKPLKIHKSTWDKIKKKNHNHKTHSNNNTLKCIEIELYIKTD